MSRGNARSIAASHFSIDRQLDFQTSRDPDEPRPGRLWTTCNSMTTAPAVLAINAGSSTVKCALFTFDKQPRLLARDVIDASGPAAMPHLLDWIHAHGADTSLRAIGHRIVHGGPNLTQPERVTPTLIDTLTGLIPFAPNHLPDELALLRVLGQTKPAVPQMHASIPRSTRSSRTSLDDCQSPARTTFAAFGATASMGCRSRFSSESSKRVPGPRHRADGWCWRILETDRAWRPFTIDRASTPRWRSLQSAAW